MIENHFSSHITQKIEHLSSLALDVNKQIDIIKRRSTLPKSETTQSEFTEICLFFYHAVMNFS